MGNPCKYVAFPAPTRWRGAGGQVPILWAQALEVADKIALHL